MISSWRDTTSLSEGKESRGASWDTHKVTEHKTNILALIGLSQSLRYREEKGSKSLLLTVANVEKHGTVLELSYTLGWSTHFNYTSGTQQRFFTCNSHCPTPVAATLLPC